MAGSHVFCPAPLANSLPSSSRARVGASRRPLTQAYLAASSHGVAGRVYASQAAQQQRSTQHSGQHLLGSLLRTLQKNSAPHAQPRPTVSPVRDPPPLGDELGWPSNFEDDYALGRCIGSGAFGTVHLALDKRTGAEVAVKTLAKQRAKQTREKTLRKLVREKHVLSRLQSCANAVRLLGAYEDDGFAYLVMEHLTGGDLEQLLTICGTFNERQAAALIQQCLKVVAACHAQNIVHGDLKPANFLLRDTMALAALRQCREATLTGPWLKAVDFGCSQTVPDGEVLTRRTGTPVYMAPEVFRREYGCQADLWSCGMMMYHLLSARFPYWETMEACKSSTLDEVMQAVINNDVRLDIAPFVSLSRSGHGLLRAMLTRDAGQRISAEQALQHSWFREQLGGATDKAAGEAVGNIVPFPLPVEAPAGMLAAHAA